MKDNLTEIVFILDRSGSMYNLVDDTIGGYNSFIKRQKNTDGDAMLTTVLFDDEYEVIHRAVNIKEVKPLTNKEYYTRGMTAMCDAIGKTINDVGARLNALDESERPSKVIFVITTDGYENASVEFNKAHIREMIKHQTEKYHWEFIFLGANIDSASEAMNIGIDSSYSSKFNACSTGVNTMYNVVANTVSTYRSTGLIPKDWNSELN